MRTLMELRQTVIRQENDQTPKLAHSENIRAGASNVLQHGQKAQIWLPGKKRWKGTYRFIFDSGRNCYLELGSSVIEAPSRWVRPVVEMGNLDSLEGPKEAESSKESTITPESIRDRDGPRSSDGAVGPKPPNVGCAPAFVPWGKYNLRPHTHCIWNSIDMGSSVVFNVDDNIWQPMGDDSVGKLTHEALINTESPHAETAEEWKSVLFDRFGVVDLSRMPPRVFLTLVPARASIREELRGILTNDNAGIPLVS